MAIEAMSDNSGHHRIRLGMVGGGQGAFIGAVHRMAARLDDRYLLMAGALSSDPQRAAASALELGIANDRCYSRYQDMAEQESQREDGIEAVSIVTPNHMHFPIAKKFIECGIHVICDKPITRTLEEALELEELSRSKNLEFVLTHNYTGYPMIQEARQRVLNGELGDLRVVQVEYAQDWLTEQVDNKQADWRTDPAKAGEAGCLGDIGTHAFNLLEFVTAEKVSRVSADLSTFVKGRRVDDNVQVMLRLSNGSSGSLWSSQVAPGNENGLRLRVYGSKGGIEWNQENPNSLKYTSFGKTPVVITPASNGLTAEATRLSRIPAGHPEGYLEAFANLYRDFSEVLLARRQEVSIPAHLQWLPGINEGVSGMRFIDAVLKSSRSDSHWVDLD